ncbi:FtsX-like permease family protein [Deinococcus antarcticus]|uniref:FtsX-like permease family protein n=1 Tax=Deinococcus antarcticus TaxID=1298767 RepID=A0ABV8A6L0_9DEIO
MTTISAQPSVRTRSNSAAPLLRMAWRNLWRQRQRTVLLLIVVAYATLSIVLFWALYDGFSESAMLGHARYLGASVLVEAQAYRDDPDPANALKELTFLATLRGQPGVLAAVPRLEFPALARSASQSQGLLARGVDPAQESKVSNIPSRIREGRMLRGTGEVVLGESLARRLDVRLNERLVLNTSGSSGLQATGLKVVGLVYSGVAAVDDGAVLISLTEARRLTGVTTATAVAVETRRGQEKVVAAAVAAALPAGVRATDVEGQLGALGDAMKAKSGSMTFIGLLFALFAALAVVSTVLVSVLERTREFGMELAVGMRHAQIALMVTLECLISTTLGWLIGLILGYGIAAVFAHWNILGPVFAGYGDAVQSMGTGDEIHMALRPQYLLYSAVTIAAALVLSILIPARRVRQLNPAEAMRVE